VTSLIGRTLGHFRIVDEVGEGGMGVVYRARDEHLERHVAVKVLPRGAVVDDAARKRFRDEALTLSRLSHPGIATIHDFAHEDGMDFLVMEYIDGVRLSERIAAGPLPEREVLDIGMQVAEALETAHECGVTHHDLKPDNMILAPRGNVKVLDFGLARMRQEGLSRLTARSRAQATIAIGTLGYMAPEQLIGNEPDLRADLYSLGVVLYEMSTGRHPFESDLQTALVYQITNQPPPPPGRFRRDLSRRLEDLILKCLEKDPADRYQSARELAVDLRRLKGPALAAAAPAEARVGSLAVLPLENVSGDPEQEFFTDGMTDALIADLAQIESLRVISRTSVMRYKGARRPLPEIARELRVDAVLEGSVVRSGERVRITVQLIDALTDRHIWARSYQRDVCDVLALQSEVARAVADEIQLELSPREEARLRTVRRVDPAAHDAYLRGRHLWNRRSRASLAKALEYFQRAIDVDPTFAAAHAGIADAHSILATQNFTSPKDGFARARAAARRAIELDPELAEAHTSMAFVHSFHDWAWTEAEASYRRALESNPGYATARQWHAQQLTAEGRFDEALAEAKHALALDPLSPIIHSSVADVHFYRRDYDESLRALEYGLELDTGFSLLRQDMGRALLHLGRAEEAVAVWERTTGEMGGDPATSPILAYGYTFVGRRDEARAILGRLVAAGKERHVSSWAVAAIHWGLGDLDAAFEWLERAFDERDRGMAWLKVHPRFEKLHDDPRFVSLLERMRFPG